MLSESPLEASTRRAFVERACELGFPLACAQHAAYLTALTTPRLVDAVPAASVACSAGLGNSCNLLGELLLGLGERSRAREAFQRGCVAGHLACCRHDALTEDTDVD